jgi:hypothetical protein
MFGPIIVIGLFFIPACTALPSVPAPANPNSGSLQPPTTTPFQPVAWTPTPEPPTPTPSPTPAPYSIWIDPQLPEAILDSVVLPAEIAAVPEPDSATLRLEISSENPVGTWTFALVAPFPTVQDEITAPALRQFWRGEAQGFFGDEPLLLAAATLEVLSAWWGEPAAGSVKVVEPDDLLPTAWDRRPAWAIVPFEELNPRWKVLAVDEVSPIHKEFDPQSYALSVSISLLGDSPIQPIFSATNRDPNKLTTVAMTGVTALVRATAYTMERYGINYPAQDIGAWLREADITHISNEVPFAENCPYPNPVQEGMKFCSDPRYIKLLEHVGTDVVELTGDHFADWGPQAMLYTLEKYDERGWPYYGGGKNLEAGRQAVTLTHNGNQLAFIGCNAKGGGYAQASTNNPGAVACNFNWMQTEIERLHTEGYLPIATFQHFEYYTYAAQPNQVRDARKLAEAGAVIVSGSQAHHPQAFGFDEEALIHHGLGNLFFDQLDVSSGARQGFIDRHVFYNGRHVSTELLTIWFVDYARARPMSTGEREQLLKAVFRASGW